MTAGTRVLSVDVEDYFHVEAFASTVSRDEWASFPSRVEANTHRILELFSEHGAAGTFFILGWVAERFPRLVAAIAAGGHEVACHSHWHRLVYGLTPDEFRDDTRRAKASIEDASGMPVSGYRAPSFSITRRSSWAYEVLAELGFTYDSSVFPVHHDVYGIPDAPRTPFRVTTDSGPIVEYPLTTFTIAGRLNMPVGGGAYLRILPRVYTRLGLRRAARQGSLPILYVHPWELDPDQPRVKGLPLRSRLRHYTRLGRTASELVAWLEESRPVPFQEAARTVQPIDVSLAEISEGGAE